MNFEFVAVSDIWNRRREEGAAYIQKVSGNNVDPRPQQRRALRPQRYRRRPDRHRRLPARPTRHRGRQSWPRRLRRKAHRPHAWTTPASSSRPSRDPSRIMQVGTQRRCTPSYQQGGRIHQVRQVRRHRHGRDDLERQPARTLAPPRSSCRCSRKKTPTGSATCSTVPHEPFDARKYLEFRLFWPYSSGIPDQWLVHQIDTVHWFTGLPHPRSVVANGGIYLWKDGRTNWDTMTAVFDYGPLDDLIEGLPGPVLLALHQLRRRRQGALLLQRRHDRHGQADRHARRRPHRKVRRRDEDAGQPAAQLLARWNKAKQSPPTPTPTAIRKPQPTCATGWSASAPARRRTPASKPATATPSRSA